MTKRQEKRKRDQKFPRGIFRTPLTRKKLAHLVAVKPKAVWASSTARKARFKPAEKDGQPVPAKMALQFEFRLQD